MSLSIHRSRGPNSQAIVQLGNQIKCDRCGIVKNKAAFDDRALYKLAEHAAKNSRFNAKITEVVACMECTVHRAAEMKCFQCDKWKPLTDFSKTQRRERENAKCWDCIREQVNTEPAGQSSSEASDSGSECSEAFYSGGEETASTIHDSIGGSTIASSRVPRIGATEWATPSNAQSVTSGYTAARSMASTMRSVATDAASSTSGGVSLPPRTASSAGRSFNKPSAGSTNASSMVAADSDDDDSDSS